MMKVVCDFLHDANSTHSGNCMQQSQANVLSAFRKGGKMLTEKGVSTCT